jgi:hypothetical protein
MELPTLGVREGPPSSIVLKDILDQAPLDFFTLSWLMLVMHERSFGIIMLLLAVLATVPVGSTLPGLMLAALAVQMIAGRSEPIFPHFVTARRLPTKYLLQLGGRAIPVLAYLEKVIHPRWPAAFKTTKRAVGVIVLLLTIILLLTPIPLSNVAPAILTAVMALAYIEEDGLVLSCALLAAIGLIGAASAAVWGTILGAVLISHIW